VPALPERDRPSALPERSSHRSTTEHGSRRTTPALPERDRPPALPERDRPPALPECPPPTIRSKVEVPKKKRARDDHTGRDATPPRRASPRRTPPTVELAQPDESRESPPHKVLKPVEPPPTAPCHAPKRHQHPLPSTAGKRNDRKGPPSAALGASPKSTSSTSIKEPATKEKPAPAESSTRGSDRAERPIATLVPRKPTEPEALVSLRQDLALSSSLAGEEEEEIPLVIDAGRPDWSDVEPDSDRETTMTVSPRVELLPPPI